MSYKQTPMAFAISFASLKLGVTFPVSILFIAILDTPTFLPNLYCDNHKGFLYFSIWFFKTISLLF